MLTPELLLALVEELAGTVKAAEKKNWIQGRICGLNGCPLEFLFKKIFGT